MSVTSLSAPVLAEYSDLWVSYANAGGPTGGLVLGAKAYTGDGRAFRFTLAGATDLVAGTVQQTPAQVADHENIAVEAAGAVGDTSLSVTLGAAAVTADEYRDGYVMTSTGYSYSIKGHSAASANATLVLTLSDPLKAALTTPDTVDLVLNPYNGVIQAPTTLTGSPAGVAFMPTTAKYYGWIQVEGAAATLSHAAVTVGDSVGPSTTTAGAVEAFTGAIPPVGYAMQTLTSGDTGPVWLTIG